MSIPVPLPDLAEDWLEGLRATGTASTSGRSAAVSNGERARRSDLANWAGSLCAAIGRPHAEPGATLAERLGPLTTADLSTENLVAAFRHLQAGRKPATIHRHLSTLRSFTRWLTTRGHLTTDPTQDDHLRYRAVVEPEVRAFTVDDVTAMIAAAATPPPRTRSAWATRDQAIIDLLASTGIRAAEACALELRDLAQADQPLLLVRRGTKSGRRREIPLPHHTTGRLQLYLTERTHKATTNPAMSMDNPKHPLLVRNDATPFTTDSLYHLIRRLAHAAHTTLPDNALIHALRHHYGLQLALRRVPTATLQQLMGHTDPRTTAIYTRHAPDNLITTLNDAGWL